MRQFWALATLGEKDKDVTDALSAAVLKVRHRTQHVCRPGPPVSCAANRKRERIGGWATLDKVQRCIQDALLRPLPAGARVAHVSIRPCYAARQLSLEREEIRLHASGRAF